MSDLADTSCQNNPTPNTSRKREVFKASTPVKPRMDCAIALQDTMISGDLWDQVDEKRKEISILNQQISPFLQLSAEIRNIIYSYALGHRTFRFKDAIYRRHARLRPHEPHVLALLRVCHQIYSEASLFPYSLNVFSFRDFEISFKPFLNHRQLAHFRAITTIELVTYQAGRMWAAPELFSRDLDELKVLERLPNLREVRVVVDLNMSLYVERAGGFDFNMIWQNQKVLTDGVRDIREDVLVRFFWA